jgi:molybdopterin/thiamine biosynthesis adenylyltransferase
VTTPRAAEPLTRYDRQVRLAQIGTAGQAKLAASVAVIAGLGALGTTVADLLARAGVGTLRLVDRDFVDWSNLQRQHLYDEEDAARSLPKVHAAVAHLQRINSEIRYEPIVEDINAATVERIVASACLSRIKEARRARCAIRCSATSRPLLAFKLARFASKVEGRSKSPYSTTATGALVGPNV